MEEGLTSWTRTMASPIPLQDIILKPDEHLEASGEDLRDYYYLYQVTEERACRNAISLQLSLDEAKQFQCFKGLEEGHSFYVPALRTLAMGDINAVEIGQESHMVLALQAGFEMEEFITMKGKFPRAGWGVGIIIDDFVVIEAVREAEGRDSQSKSAEMADMMVASYKSHGLEPHDKKRFRRERNPKFWGALVEGEAGLLRAQLERTLPITNITMQLAKLGAGSRKLLEILAGAWISIMQFRRRCMCLMAAIFDEIQAHSYEEIFRLPVAVVQELWMMAILAPLLCADLRAQPHTELSLVDASGDFRAEVSTQLPSNIAAELTRHRLTKAAWSRLLSPIKAWQRLHGRLSPEDEVPAGETPSQAHPVWTQLSRALRFETKWCKSIKKKTHINVSELLAALEAESRRARASPSTRPLIASDSQVSLGALIKGRSSSAGLNGLLRRFLPVVLSYNISTCWQYIGTLDNVADDPTRRRDCREPSAALPNWYSSASEGDFRLFDEFLVDQELDEAKLAELPELHDVTQDVDKHVNVRQLKRAHWMRSSRTGLGQKLQFKPPVAASFRASPWLPKTALSDEVSQLLETIPTNQFVVPRGQTLDEVWKLKGHLDLFSGCRVAAQKLANCSGRWVLCYDLKHHASEDLLNPHVQTFLVTLLTGGAFLSLTAGPVCASFSRAVCPAVRSRLQPEGIDVMTDSMREKVLVGNAMAKWLAGFTDIALSLHLVVWIENPAGSFLWLQPCWVELINKFQLAHFMTDYCRWGTPWRKRAKFYGSFAAAGQKLLCQCSGRHIQLRGYSHEFGVSWTKAAEQYPPRLASFLAAAVVESLKPLKRQRPLDPAKCAKCTNRRIGEASNPGPRQRRPRSDVPDLEAVDLIRPATQLLQRRVHSRFVEWLESELGSDTLNFFATSPQLQLHFVRTFGNFLYQRNEPMYLFRHLVVYLQQMFPSYRGLMSTSWDLLARWELVQPVDHRPPMPKLILDAFISLGLSWGWHRWCAATLLAFHGAMRAGETLRAKRSDLLLPCDSGLERNVLFLQVQKPKPGRRGRGRVQHARITDSFAIRVATAIFEHLQPGEFLYPVSPSTFRRRWDHILSVLGIPSALRLTPGCLRSGGCVFWYHQDMPVNDILWHMRLRHVATLEHYLEETAAINLMLQLPSATRTRIKSCAQMLPFIAQTLFHQ